MVESSCLSLEATSRFSVFSLQRHTHDSVTDGEKEIELLSYGSDIPLSDVATQILLEQMNLAPRDTTLKRATLQTCILPAPCGSSLIVEQDASISHVGQGGTGGIIWPASQACIDFLASFGLSSIILDPRKELCVLELGAGTGLLGIATGMLLAKMGVPFKMLLTDLRHVVPLLMRNVGRNIDSLDNHGSHKSSFDCLPCDWNSEKDRFRLLDRMKEHLQSQNGESSSSSSSPMYLLLCSDLVFGNNFSKLISFLDDLQCSFGGANRCPILFAFEEREDRYPSPGFSPELHKVFHVEDALEMQSSLKARHLQHWPRTELYWLRSRKCI